MPLGKYGQVTGFPTALVRRKHKGFFFHFPKQSISRAENNSGKCHPPKPNVLNCIWV